MQAIPSKTDILGFNLNADQQAHLYQLHNLCAQRMDVKLPAINSARCKAYDTIHALDARIEKYAPLLELTRTSGDIVTAVSASDHTRAVWQYWFIKNPISM